MKFGSKFRHGATALGITAAVIVAVILLNVGVTALCSGALWFGDTTSEKMYTLDSATKTLLKDTFTEVNETRLAKGEENVQVDIVFCADPDLIKSNEYMRYIYYTALELQKAFPKIIHVKTTDVWKNPSSVDAYRTNSYSSIYQSNVIVASGTEYRIMTIRSFYTYDSSDSDEPWAYNGEKIFTRSMMAVTKAEAPICGITVGHGEAFETEAGKAEYSELIKVIESAGYDIIYLDLAKQEIPENCRLLLTFDPQTDFKSAFLGDEVSEISKLSNFLKKVDDNDTGYSYMIFVDADTPELYNLEEVLEQWGVQFNRCHDETDSTVILGNEQVISEKSVDSLGQAVIGTYVTEALGGSITEDMRKYGASPKVVFPNALALSYSDTYDDVFEMADEDEGTDAYHYGSNYINAISRNVFDVFLADAEAKTAIRSAGAVLTDETGIVYADTKGGYSLMTLTMENHTVGEGQGYTNVNDASYVCAIGSTEFASNVLLSSNAYGNTDVLLQTLRAIGKEVVPVGLTFKSLYVSDMTQSYSDSGGNTYYYYTEATVTAWTVVLILLPLAAVSITGSVVLIKRKFSV